MTAKDKVWARVWSMIPEPRIVTTSVFFGYLACVLVGISSVTLAGVVGLRDIMGGLLIAGGLFGAAGAPTGQWGIERIGILGLGFALAMRTVLVVDYARPDRDFALLTLFLVFIFLFSRWVRIRLLPADPTRKPGVLERAAASRREHAER